MSRGRDNFSPKTRIDLALRSSHMCSKCKRSTSGPSDESPNAVTNIGVAAHISAAALGGPRYDSNMTVEERKHIRNGIWLCSNCSILIDRDTKRFSVAELRRIRDEHEASRRIDGDNQIDSADIIAIGPDIVAVGEVLSSGRNGFKIQLIHFVEGTGKNLLGFADEFDHFETDKRYILINEVGYGGMLNEAPIVVRNGQKYELEFSFANRTPRRNATEKIAGMCAETGHMIGGMDVFVQHFQRTLGMVRGEWFADLEFGSYLADFYWRYYGSPWFDSFAMMEIVRLASIPRLNRLSGEETTSFLCVNKVNNVVAPSFELDAQMLHLEVDFEIEGAGNWSGVLSVFISTPEQIAEGRKQAVTRAEKIKDIENTNNG